MFYFGTCALLGAQQSDSFSLKVQQEIRDFNNTEGIFCHNFSNEGYSYPSWSGNETEYKYWLIYCLYEKLNIWVLFWIENYFGEIMLLIELIQLNNIQFVFDVRQKQPGV